MKKANLNQWVLTAVVALLCSASIVVIFGEFKTKRYFFTCNVCSQRWHTKTILLWHIPIWRGGGSHLITSHVPVYTGGGTTIDEWSILGGAGRAGLGHHGMHSP